MQRNAPILRETWQQRKEMKADPAPDGSGDSLSGFWEHYRRNCGSVADIDNEVGIEAGVLGVNVAKRIADHAAVSDHVVGSGVDMPVEPVLDVGMGKDEAVKIIGEGRRQDKLPSTSQEQRAKRAHDGT